MFGTTNHGMSINATQDINIEVFSNNDWAGDITDSRSQIGFLVFLGTNLVSWSSKK